MGKKENNQTATNESSHPEDELTNAEKRRLEEELGVDRDDAPLDEPAGDDDEQDSPSAGEEAEDAEGADGTKETNDDDTDDGGRKTDHGKAAAKKPGRFKRFFAGYWRKKAWTLPLTLVVLIAGAAFGVPWSRYLILGQYIERPYSVELVDAKTQKPVSSAQVSIDGVQATTDAKGQATLRAKVGSGNLTVDKKYYQSTTKTVFVGLAAQKGTDRIQVTATGRQVPVMITDKITDKPVADAVLRAVGTEVKTDKNGKAVMVLPADKPSLSGTVSGKGFNELKVTITVTESEVKENSFAIVPAGKVYFLSRLSGKIDVVKTDLDGSNRQTVVAGTGKEEEGNTVLLASRDWKYLALLSKRSSDPSKLYLIETDTDKMSVMDEGDAAFGLSGWSGHNFVYNVTRTKFDYWQPNRQAVKSFDAEKKRLLTVDQSQAEGTQNDYFAQYLENFYLVRDKLVYTTRWIHSYSYYSSQTMDGKNSTIREVTVGTTTKKDVKTFPATQY